MKKLFGALLVAAGLVGSIPASAATYTYDLDRVLNALTPTSGWGTVTISDDPGNSSNVKIDILMNSTYKPLALYLNFLGCASGQQFFTTPSFTGGTDASVACNAQQADGYTAGKFDLQVPDTGNLGNINDISFILSATGLDLNAADFNQLDTSGLLFVGLHVGNINAAGDSIWLASSGTTRVPEPSALALLGIALTALAGGMRRRSRK